MSRMSDANWLRDHAARPLSRRQPIYEAARLTEIAARLEQLEADNALLKQYIHLTAEFMQAEARGDLAGMTDLMTKLVPLTTQVQQIAESHLVASSDVQVEVSLGIGGDINLQTDDIYATQAHIRLSRVGDQPARNGRTVDADPQEQ